MLTRRGGEELQLFSTRRPVLQSGSRATGDKTGRNGTENLLLRSGRRARYRSGQRISSESGSIRAPGTRNSVIPVRPVGETADFHLDRYLTSKVSLRKGKIIGALSGCGGRTRGAGWV
jgi:hypothetical protein